MISISSTCFGRYFRPFSGALDCVYSLWCNAPSMLPAGSIDGAGLILCAATCLQSGQVNLVTLEGGSCTVSEAVVTVLRIPDDGCG